MERDQLLKDAHIKTLQETLQMRETEVSRQLVQLAERSREVSAAHARVVSAERRAHDALELASLRSVEGKARSSRELAAAARTAAAAQAEARVRSYTSSVLFCHAGLSVSRTPEIREVFFRYLEPNSALFRYTEGWTWIMEQDVSIVSDLYD